MGKKLALELKALQSASISPAVQLLRDRSDKTMIRLRRPSKVTYRAELLNYRAECLENSSR